MPDGRENPRIRPDRRDDDVIYIVFFSLRFFNAASCRGCQVTYAMERQDGGEANGKPRVRSVNDAFQDIVRLDANFAGSSTICSLKH